jgi:hypothetical protein
MSKSLLNAIVRHEAVLKAIIIGSDINETEFSDTDVVILLNKPKVETTIRYKWERYRLLYRMFSNDILQHHDLVFEGLISECTLPVSVLGFDSNDLCSEVDSAQVLITHVQGLKKLIQSDMNNDYILKLVVASVLLLPLRILNAKGVYCTKKDSFGLIKECIEYERIKNLLELCESMRLKWSRPSPKLIHTITLMLWPRYRVNHFYSFLYRTNYKSFKLELEIIRNEIKHLSV